MRRNFLIESKRFSNPEQKIYEAKNDIERMRNQKHIELLEKNLHGIKIAERYAILMADVWRENNAKEKIYSSWPDEVCSDAFWSMKLEIDSVKNYSLLALAVEL